MIFFYIYAQAGIPETEDLQVTIIMFSGLFFILPLNTYLFYRD